MWCRKQRQVKLTECRTAVGAFGGGEYTNGVYATALMVVKAGSSDRPAIPGLNSPPFLPAEILRETMVHYYLALSSDQRLINI